MAESIDPLVSLRRHAQAAPFSLGELVTAANLVIDSGGVIQSDRVLLPRTVRHYVSRGVVSAPFGRGRGSSWGYRHLVELVHAVVRRAEGESLPAIAGRRRASEVAELERFVAERATRPVAPPAEKLRPPGLSTRSAAAGDADGAVVFPVCAGVELRLAVDHPLASSERELTAIARALALEIETLKMESR